ncbi:MAG: DUF1254 domain-containing protein [Gammaproteobacteria bacterium]
MNNTAMLVACIILSGTTAATASEALTAKKTTRYHASLAAVPFKNDYPTKETASILQKELAFQRATQTYLWSLPAVNMMAMKEGHEALMDGEGYYKLGIYEDRLKPNTLITTPNSDVIYGLGWINMKDHGPMVIEAPERMQALINDMWHKALVGPINEKNGQPYKGDIGLPGPDRGKGGLYLILPPGESRADYDAKKYFIYESDTYDVFLFLRGFFDDASNLKPAVDNMEKIKVYPLKGKRKKMQFFHLSDINGNSIAPHDWTYFAMLDRLIQKEENNKIDPYMNGMLATIGIKKGVKFAPSDAEKKMLTNAAQTGWKMAKEIAANFDEKGSVTTGDTTFWEGSYWVAHALLKDNNMFGALVDTEYNDLETGHTLVDAKAHMYINHYSISNGMFSSMVGAGAKYAGAYKDSKGRYLNGSCTYSLTLPANVPAGLFWSVTAYDASTAAGLGTNNKYPSIGDRDQPKQNKDGSTTLYFGPQVIAGKPAKNYLHTPENKGWFSLIRLYAPQKSFFERTWRPGDFKKISCK